MPLAVAQSVSGGVAGLCGNASGGRVAFETDSPFVVIVAEMKNVGKMPHFTTLGSCGFDLYADGRFYQSFVPDYGISDGYAGTIQFPRKHTRRLLMHFPLYSEVVALHIGLAPDSMIGAYHPYEAKLPIVYYGSSITQGGMCLETRKCLSCIDCSNESNRFCQSGFFGQRTGRGGDGKLYCRAADERLCIGL